MASIWTELKSRNVLRIAAAYLALSWLIVQIIETLFPMFGLSDATARVIVIVLAIGFVPALIFAWAFELTPEGLRRDGEVDHNSPASRKAGRRLDRLVMMLLALGIGYFAADKFVLDPKRDQAELVAATEKARLDGRAEATIEAFGDRSIAVLPFVNMSSDAEQDYFADGISEELLNLLSRIPELRVISRSSAFLFKDTEDDIPTIARKLNVSHVLEGSVRKSGNAVRISVQLIEARSDTHLWSETYDRTLDDIFAIQDEVSGHVVEQLELKLLGSGLNSVVVDPRAYDFYLQARSIVNIADESRFPLAESILRKALAIEPDYIDALGLLAFVTSDKAEAEFLTAKIMELDPDNARIKSFNAVAEPDYESAARLVQEAVVAEPSDPLVLFNAARVAKNIGRVDAAIRLSEHIAARDPLSFWTHANLGDYYAHAGQIDDAYRAYERAIELNPTANAIHWKFALAMLVNGEPEKALEQIELEQGQAYRLHGFALVYHDLGRQTESNTYFEKLVEIESGPWPFGLARAYAWIGDADKALDYLEQSAESQWGLMGGLGTHPLFRRIHDDPRWQTFLESIGQTPEQLGRIRLEIDIPD